MRKERFLYKATAFPRLYFDNHLFVMKSSRLFAFVIFAAVGIISVNVQGQQCSSSSGRKARCGNVSATDCPKTCCFDASTTPNCYFNKKDYGQIRHINGLCINVEDGFYGENTSLIWSTDCTSRNAFFLVSNYLPPYHVASGKCVLPPKKRSLGDPGKSTNLVLRSDRACKQYYGRYLPERKGNLIYYYGDSEYAICIGSKSVVNGNWEPKENEKVSIEEDVCHANNSCKLNYVYERKFSKGENRSFRCESCSSNIEVVWANYGEQLEDAYPSIISSTNPNCMSKDVTSLMQTKCNGKAICSFTLQDDDFMQSKLNCESEPILLVRYTCQNTLTAFTTWKTTTSSPTQQITTQKNKTMATTETGCTDGENCNATATRKSITTSSTQWNTTATPPVSGCIGGVKCNATATRKSATTSSIRRNTTMASVTSRCTDGVNCNSTLRTRRLGQLAEKKVDVNNVVVITEETKQLSSLNDTLKPEDINNIAKVLEKVAEVRQRQNKFAEDFFATIDNVLDAKLDDVLKSQEKFNSSTRMIKALNALLESIDIGPQGNYKKVAKNYDVNLQDINLQTYDGITFFGAEPKSEQVLSKATSNLIVFNDSVPCSSTACISIPSTVFDKSPGLKKRRFIFVSYKETKFFRMSQNDTERMSSHLNSIVIAGSVKGLPVENLTHPVKITFQYIRQGNTNTVFCSYWNLEVGNWSQNGCRFEGVLKDGRILCHCNHLTNFAMLMDVNPALTTKHESIFSVVSYIGCAISLLGLVLTIITILTLRDLRCKIPNQILLNFCTALSLLLITFLVAPVMNDSSLIWCRISAVALHYFLLAAFFWMAVQAFSMYRAFVKVIAALSSRSNFMWKCCLLAWGIPAIIVAITMGVAMDKYGDQKYCRLLGVPFYVAFLAPVTLILVGNTVAFCVIIRSLFLSADRVSSTRETSGYQEVRQAFAIMVLLGLTWLFGIFAIDGAKLVFQWLFCIFNTLQGFFIFLFYCVLNTGTRKRLAKQIQRKKSKEKIRLQEFTRQTMDGLLE